MVYHNNVVYGLHLLKPRPLLRTLSKCLSKRAGLERLREWKTQRLHRLGESHKSSFGKKSEMPHNQKGVLIPKIRTLGQVDDIAGH